MDILITGGAGFIGSHMAGHCIARGHSVTIIDNLSTGLAENIPEGAAFLPLDLSDPSFPDRLKDISVDIVVHLAAQSSGEISFERPVYDLSTNTQGTLLLLRWAMEHSVKKFIYSSSMSVYGDGPDRPLKETDPLNPKSFYGVGKCASEHYISIFQDMGLDTTIFRFFNVYGPGQNMKNLKQGMVSIFMAYIAQQQPILVKGPLDRFRDFVYIDDVISALDLGIENRSATGGIYNVCTGRKTTIRSLLDTIIGAYGFSPGQYPVQEAAPTPRDQFGAYGDPAHIERHLHWKPNVNLEQGIERMKTWVDRYYLRQSAGP